MPAALTSDQLAQRARVELDKAELPCSEMITFGRTAARTNRLRAAKRRARGLLRRAVRRGMSEDEARRIYESAPPDPEFGPAEW